MRIRLKTVCIVIAFTLISALVFGCTSSNGPTTESADNSEDKVNKSETSSENGSKSESKEIVPTKENPMVVDKENGVIKVYTEVNAKYFVEPTRHCVVMRGGTFGDKPILAAWANPADFYNALIEIGAKAGNKVKLDSPPGTIVEGDLLKVTVDVDGKEYDFSEIYKSEPEKGWEPRFGGNLENSKIKNTGCLLCFDSCSVGIVSNAKYGYKDFNDGKAKFYGKQEILKEDKKPVIVYFELKNK